MLAKCAALGSLSVASALSLPQAIDAWDAHESARKATPWNELGPFYKRQAPKATHLRRPSDVGIPLAVSGRVLNTRGNAIPGATLEIWHANHLGHYDLDGYRFRTTLSTPDSGKYAFDSIIPGHYPDRVCQHVHYLITAPGHKPLTTQMYFATDSAFEGDPDKNYTKDPLVQSRDLIRPVTLSGEPKRLLASVTFEIVLEQL